LQTHCYQFCCVTDKFALYLCFCRCLMIKIWVFVPIFLAFLYLFWWSHIIMWWLIQSTKATETCVVHSQISVQVIVRLSILLAQPQWKVWIDCCSSLMFSISSWGFRIYLEHCLWQRWGLYVEITSVFTMM